MRRKNYRILIFALISLVCFGCGMLLPEMIKMNSGTYAGFFSIYSFGKFQQSEWNVKELFLYILSVRMELFLFLWMSSFTGAGIFLHTITAGWILGTAGILLRLFLMKKGIQGAMIFLCSLMPQWILYMIMWKKELSFCLRGGEVKWREKTVRFMNLLVLCIGGCACEAYLGIPLQKKILTFLR